MGMGPIVWTCLALTLHQSPEQPLYINTRNVGLPLSKKDQERKDIQQFTLLYSADEGKTWEQGESKRPGDPRLFEFHAPKDGVYWFIVQQEDLAHKVTPRDPNRMKPTMVMIVDATRPQVQVTAERLPNGKIRAHWKAADANADPRSLRLDYHTSVRKGEDQWSPLLPSPVLEGNMEFDPGPEGKTGEVRVRVHMKDYAGNVGEDVYVLQATAASPAPVLSSPNVGETKMGPAEGSPISLIPNARSDPPGQPNQLASRQTQRPLIEAAPGSMIPAAPPAPELGGPSSTPAPFVALPIASNTQQTPLPAGNLAESPANYSAVRIVKSPKVRIDFTVGKVGPSGLGNADVYVSVDRGQTWKKMPGEVPVTLPQNADLRGEVSGWVGVELPAEGIVYGFIVAVKSRAGLAPPPPNRGDPPQALVELDTTAPQGNLFRPQLDPSQPNTLVLGWEAKDRNFGDKPVTLEWAERKDGPWTVIGEPSLPNTGQYPWRLPERLPPRVYLRLTMCDQAGNKNVAQTDKPELIDLSVPQTKITGVAPAGR